MSVFGGTNCFEQEELDSIKKRFPSFRGEVPPEARYWTEDGIEEFFRSQGKIRPDDASTQTFQACPLLSRLRLQLAESKVRKPTSEYLSFCKHRQQRSNLCTLPDIASCKPVQRVREAPDKLKEPVTIMPRRDKAVKAEEWNIEWLQTNFGNALWQCQSRAPVFHNDVTDACMLEACIGEYVEYMEVIANMDPDCLEENALAYPRVHIDGWCPFINFAREAFEKNWKELNPPGVKDFTARWCEMYAGILEDGDWIQHLAATYRLDLGAAGSCTRLHTENHGAHAWFTQIEGQRLFFLFPPGEAGRLYEDRGGYVDIGRGLPMHYTATSSPVDPMFPSQKKHPRFSEANARVALLGEGKTLVVPAGWWWCSVVLEPSLTLRHNFWGMENRTRIVEEWWAPFENRTAAEREDLRPVFTELREELMQDDGSFVAKYRVIDGG